MTVSTRFPLHPMIHQADKKTTEEDRRLSDSDHSTWFLSSFFLTPLGITSYFINPRGIKGKKIIGTPSKAPGNITGGKYSKKVSRESKRTETFTSALLYYSWHNLFPIFIQGLSEKANQSDGHLTFSLPSGLLSPEYDCSTTGPESGSDTESAFKIMSCILSN